MLRPKCLSFLSAICYQLPTKLISTKCSVMKYNYYPGCTLKAKGAQLEQYAFAAADKLGFELKEQQDWQCCGAVYPMGKDEIATRLSSIRALADAKADDGKLVTLCSACHHVIKRVNYDMKHDPEINKKANAYMELPEKYNGETDVIHYLELLRDEIGFDKIKEQVVKPLTGQKIAAYYGCMLLRPASVMQFDDAENPTIIEDFIRALGGEPVLYSYRNDCCGGYITLSEKKLACEMVNNIMQSAQAAGAQMIISACPLCNYNLENNCSEEYKMPVYYFTQILAEALGVKE